MLEPTTDACAIRVLQVLRAFNVRSGEILMQGSFIGPFCKDGWRMSDFQRGATQAAENGWVLIENGGAMLRLTDKGAQVDA